MLRRRRRLLENATKRMKLPVGVTGRIGATKVGTWPDRTGNLTFKGAPMKRRRPEPTPLRHIGTLGPRKNRLTLKTTRSSPLKSTDSDPRLLS